MTTIKLALGTITTSVHCNHNMRTKDFIKIAQDDIKNLFPIEESASIEIVEGGLPERFCEMGEKLPDSDELLINHASNITFFYARVVLVVNNEEYIKTNREDGPVYFKKREYNGNQSPMLTERQMREISENSIRPRPPETCGICYENEVQSIRIYRCRHLFCGACISNWIDSCAYCRSPCRLN